MLERRRELDLINKHIDRHHEQVGEYIVWFPFLALGEGSGYDDVYDEGDVTSVGRTYAEGIVVPTIYVEEIEDESRAIEEGRQPTQNLRVVLSYESMENAGVPSPREYQPRLKDMFLYDDRYYNVYRYRARGHLYDEVLVSVEGVETYRAQEMVYDNPPSFPVLDIWPDTLPD